MTVLVHMGFFIRKLPYKVYVTKLGIIAILSCHNPEVKQMHTPMPESAHIIHKALNAAVFLCKLPNYNCRTFSSVTNLHVLYSCYEL